MRKTSIVSDGLREAASLLNRTADFVDYLSLDQDMEYGQSWDNEQSW